MLPTSLPRCSSSGSFSGMATLTALTDLAPIALCGLRTLCEGVIFAPLPRSSHSFSFSGMATLTALTDLAPIALCGLTTLWAAADCVPAPPLPRSSSSSSARASGMATLTALTDLAPMALCGLRTLWAAAAAEEVEGFLPLSSTASTPPIPVGRPLSWDTPPPPTDVALSRASGLTTLVSTLLPIPSRVSRRDFCRYIPIRSIDTLLAPIARVGDIDALRPDALPLDAPPLKFESGLKPMETSITRLSRDRETDPDRADVAPLTSRGTWRETGTR